jgi:glycosyltransferase involved in cell wall biosynthesis
MTSLTRAAGDRSPAPPPVVTIVTVCLNSAATIVDALRSVNQQDYPAIEHIVIDGGSSDGTQELVRCHGERVVRLVSEPDAGIYDAMNKGLALASGEFVGFLNADDVLARPDSLSRIVAAMTAGIDACYGDVVYVAKERPDRVVRYWRSGSYRRGQCANGWAPPHPTLYVRRDIFTRLGGFDASMRVAADFEFALRMLDVHGTSVSYVPDVLVRMRTGGVSNGNVKGILRGHRELAAALRIHGFQSGWGWSLRRLLRRIPQFLSRPAH